MTKIYFDTEFIEDGRTIDLISIGMVTETPGGPELYMVSSEFDESKACPWVRENVLSKIPADFPRFSRQGIANAVSAFVFNASLPTYITPQIWAYYADYDWVSLCQLFGRMIDLPPWFPKYARDLKQLVDSRGFVLPKPNPADEHHALNDARWVRDQCVFLSRHMPIGESYFSNKVPV